VISVTDSVWSLRIMAEDQKRRKSSSPSDNQMDNRVVLSRPAYTQSAFDELYLKKDGDDSNLKEKVCSNVYCSKKRMWKLLCSYLPIIKFMRYYKFKEYAVNDVFSGLTVGILHIPQALAFGALTSVKVENGLFTSLWPVLLYVFFGTSAHVSMGTSAVICILTAATVDREALSWAETNINMTDVGDSSLLDEYGPYLDYKEQLAMGIALISGLIMIVMGILKLGFITAYLSDSFFTAFTSAAAVHIGTSQVPSMLGIKVARFGGVFKIIYTYEAIIGAISGVNVAAVCCAVVSCVVILFVKDCINERFKHKLPAPIPIELFVVIIGTVVSYFGQFRENFKIDVVGTIPTDIPAPDIPYEGLKAAPNYCVDAFILAILIFANTIAMAKICAKKHNYEVDDSQELIAYGMCNAASSFFFCFPSSVAPPRSMVASSMNAKTTLSGVFASVLMLLVIIVISKLFTELPKAVLAAIVFIALKGLFIQILDGRKFWRINKFDFVIWFFTFFATVFLDIDVGLGIGVCVSLITVVLQTQFSRGYKIGCTIKDPALVEHKKYNDSSEVPGVKIYRFQSSLYFANAEIFRNSLYKSTVNPRKLLKGLKKREKRLVDANKQRIAQGLPPEARRNSLMMGDLGLVSQDPKQGEKVRRKSQPTMETKIDENKELASQLNGNGNSSVVGKSFTMTQEKAKKSENGNGYNHFQQLRRRESTISINFDEDIEEDEDGDEMISDDKLRAMRKIHHIIIDCVTINYLDASGANVLAHIVSEYGHVNIKVFLAGCSADMLRSMEHAGSFEKIPRDHLFVDVQDALVVAKPLRTLPLSSDALDNFSDDEANEDSYVTKLY